MSEKALLKTAEIRANLLTWLTVHGNLCLALRHPENRGASRSYVVQFTKQLGQALVKWGVITQAQLREAHKLELEEGSNDLVL